MSEQEPTQKARHAWGYRLRRISPWLPYVAVLFPLLSAYRAATNPTALFKPGTLTVEGLPEGVRAEGIELVLVDPTAWERFVAAGPWMGLAVGVVVFLTGLRTVERRARKAKGHPFPSNSISTAVGSVVVLMIGVLVAQNSVSAEAVGAGEQTSTLAESTFGSVLLLLPLYAISTIVVMSERGKKEYDELEEIV